MSKDLETISVLDDYLIVDTTDRRVCEISNPAYDRMFRGSRFANEMATLLVEYRNRIAELEEQLKNAIVPKFKIGQKVWTEWKGMIVELTIKSLYWDINQVVEYRLKGNMYLMSRWENEVFATKEEAQAKLQELKGE